MPILELTAGLSEESHRGEAGKRDEVSDHVGLVEVAAPQRQVGPVGRRVPPQERDRALEALDAREALGRHPDLGSKDFDQPAVAQPDVIRELANARLAGLELRDDVGHDAMARAATAQPPHQCCLQDSESVGYRRRCAEPTSQLGRATAPQTGQVDMRAGQLVQREPKERECAARPEVRTNDRGMCSRVDTEAAIERTGNNRTRVAIDAGWIVWVVDMDLVLREVEDELEGPLRKDALALMKRHVLEVPELLDETTERRAGLAGEVKHAGSSLPKYREGGSDARGGYTTAVLKRCARVPRMIFLAALGVLACNRAPESTASSASSGSASARVPPVDVQTFGELHKVMQEGQTGDVYAIRDALAEPHSFAVGALSGLRGEVTIRDGVVWFAYPEGERARVERDAATPEQATIFVLSHVAQWQTLPVAAPVPKAELDAFIELQAMRAGIDVSHPFPVRIEGPIVSLEWHVIDGTRLTAGGSHEDHKRAAVTGKLTHVDAQLVGFFGQSAQGVFTHMGERSHFQVIEPNSNTTGHVDDVEIASGAQLLLPARAR